MNHSHFPAFISRPTCRPGNRPAQTGAAVIMAMLIVALAASASAYLMWQNHLWFRQVENIDQQAQARWVARAAIHWAGAILQDDKNDYDHDSEQWALRLPPLDVEGGEVQGWVTDAQAKFNLNNLVQGGKQNPTELALARRLFEQQGLDAKHLNALLDWMDGDSDVSYPGGAEDMQYLALTPPSRAANRPLQSISELARVQGFTADDIRRIQPYVTALPAKTEINVNSAPAELLSALSEGLTLSEAKLLIKQRPFKDSESFRKLLPEKNTPPDAAHGVKSQYFETEVLARFDRIQVGYNALLERKEKGKSVIIKLIQREE